MIKQKQIFKEIENKIKNHKEIKVILDYELLTHNHININFMGFISDDDSLFNYTFLEIAFINSDNALKVFNQIKKKYPKFKYTNFLK